MVEIQEKFRNLPYRVGVGIIVLNRENKIFVAKRIDNPKGFWQMPQGGVDEGEDFLSAAYRELEEETSIKNVELITEIDEITTYELPNHLLGKIWKGKFKTFNISSILLFSISLMLKIELVRIDRLLFLNSIIPSST